MPNPTRHLRPRRRRPLHPASPRIANRAADVLSGIDAALAQLAAKPALLDLPLFAPQRARIESLLDTAERATARHAGPAWRQRWTAAARLTGRRAQVELHMAGMALDMTLMAAAEARPPGRRRNPSPPPPDHAISSTIRHRDGGRDERPVVERKPGGSPPGGPRGWTTG